MLSHPPQYPKLRQLVLRLQPRRVQHGGSLLCRHTAAPMQQKPPDPQTEPHTHQTYYYRDHPTLRTHHLATNHAINSITRSYCQDYICTNSCRGFHSSVDHNSGSALEQKIRTYRSHLRIVNISNIGIINRNYIELSSKSSTGLCNLKRHSVFSHYSTSSRKIAINNDCSQSDKNTRTNKTEGDGSQDTSTISTSSNKTGGSNALPISDKLTDKDPSITSKELPPNSNTKSVPASGTSQPQDGTKQSSLATTSDLSTVPRPAGVVGYLIHRYTWYIERLQKSLENEMPRTFKMFSIFSVGLKAFVSDFTAYVRVLVMLSFPSQRLEHLTLKQLELYHHMPWDMLKVFPVLAISAIPFGQNVALPFGYFFPRQLLCRHFWDIQQTHEFSMRLLRANLRYAKPVFRCVQASVDGIEPLSDRVRAQSACHQLGSGVHPTAAELLRLRPLFAGAPYSIDAIKQAHVKTLVRLYGLSAPLGRRRRLKEHARWLRCHDVAIEGGLTGDAADDYISSLHVTALKNSLLLRCISPIGLDSSGMVEQLQRWLVVSRCLDSTHDSLLLHLPILLFYNFPANLALRAR